MADDADCAHTCIDLPCNKCAQRKREREGKVRGRSCCSSATSEMAIADKRQTQSERKSERTTNGTEMKEANGGASLAHNLWLSLSFDLRSTSVVNLRLNCEGGSSSSSSASLASIDAAQWHPKKN